MGFQFARPLALGTNAERLVDLFDRISTGSSGSGETEAFLALIAEPENLAGFSSDTIAVFLEKASELQQKMHS